ncbi:unnamed protein product [Lepeophtheirus salmonis]|uniref:(salmon louse) hypothetical protein n=1 Tax=Lepeophtheirus salmonis TaxID=72036 RepID=A0A7R8CTU2_LEPSM|nr:unnamed protein product [Lepeophtheirus salmonis]CAF2928296.1 unnamed protein product [Lepeophtheirus salmonis]
MLNPKFTSIFFNLEEICSYEKIGSAEYAGAAGKNASTLKRHMKIKYPSEISNLEVLYNKKEHIILIFNVLLVSFVIYKCWMDRRTRRKVRFVVKSHFNEAQNSFIINEENDE